MSRPNVSFKKLKKLNSNGRVLCNVSFKDLCTFKCGGQIKYLVEIAAFDNFFKVLFYLEEMKATYFVLGAGSNILCSDSGYAGVVIKLIGDFARIEYDGDILECGSGVRLIDAFVTARDLGLTGLEGIAGIPASIGGATYMNAGAFDFEMSQIIDYVVAYVDGEITYFTRAECEFGYRESIFQHNNAIILRVGLRLDRGDKDEIQKKYLNLTKKRTNSQPLEYPSAGCVFKRQENVVISKLLDDCGLKGLTLGGAKVSNKHANFIINTGKATSQEIYELIKVIKKRVWDKAQIEINTEIKFLGEFDEDTW